MEHYDKLYLRQLAPLVFINYVKANPTINSLVDTLRKSSLDDTIWDNSIIKNRISSNKYKIKVKEGQFEEALGSMVEQCRRLEVSEHTIPSPLNPQSDLYPNGILSTEWFEVYLENVPFVVVSIMDLSHEPDNVDALAEAIDAARTRIQDLNVYSVTIIVHDGSDKSNSLLSQLSHVLGTSKPNSFYSISADEKTFQREGETICSSIVASFKHTATTFYSTIANKIKQKAYKYLNESNGEKLPVDLQLCYETQKLLKQGILLQLAHPQDLEPSLKLLEVSYQHLIDVSVALQDSINLQISIDNKTFIDQIRILIDINAFHIVRGYLSLEEPLRSLKKHKAHILNVLEAFKYSDSDASVWISIQYQWLAELNSLVPHALFEAFKFKQNGKRYKDYDLTSFFGGFQLRENYAYELLSNSGLLLLKAANELTYVSSISSNLDYLKLQNLNIYAFEKRIQLLRQARDYFLKESEIKTYGELSTFIRYAEWLAGEAYFMKSDKVSIIRALQFYEDAQKSFRQDDTIRTSLFIRLSECYEKLGIFDKMVVALLKSYPTAASQSIPFTSINTNSLRRVLELGDVNLKETKEIPHMFRIGATVVGRTQNGALVKDVRVFDQCLFQLLIKPGYNFSAFRSCLGGEKANLEFTLSIERIEVTFNKPKTQMQASAFKTVILERSNTLEQLEVATIDLSLDEDIFKGHFNSTFSEKDLSSNSPRVIKFIQSPLKKGTAFIKNIKLDSVFFISDGKNAISIALCDKIDSTQLSNHNAIVYDSVILDESLELMKDMKKQIIRMQGSLPYSIDIHPFRPNITVHFDSFNLLIMAINEKLVLPVHIQYIKSKDESIRYRKLNLLMNTRITSENDTDFSSNFLVQVYWDGQKDDEPLDLNKYLEQRLTSFDCKLFICVKRRFIEDKDTSDFDDKHIKLQLTGNIIVEGDDSVEDDSTVYSVSSHSLEIIDELFECNIALSPRYMDKGFSDMPCPFVLPPLSQGNSPLLDKAGTLSMPIVSRLWYSRANFTKVLKEGNQDDIDIITSEIKTETPNSEISVEILDSGNITEGDSFQLIRTVPKSGFSHRSLLLKLQVVIKWKRKFSEVVNEFISLEKEYSLPVSDPRVLLDVEKVNKRKLKFSYILENPTPRIFSFTSQLMDNNSEDFNGWEFDEKENLTPLRNGSFPVLPFTRHLMEYVGEWKGLKTSMTKLPNFKVYDINYKVFLPAIPVTHDVLSKANSLYWKEPLQ